MPVIRVCVNCGVLSGKTSRGRCPTCTEYFRTTGRERNYQKPYFRKVKRGDVFGSLTVLEFLASDSRGNKQWVCRCTCGRTQSVPATILGRKATCCTRCARRRGRTRRTFDLKSEARLALTEAVRTGLLHRPEHCQECFRRVKRIEGHHPDYSQPLRVIWLCPRCHAKKSTDYDTRFKFRKPNRPKEDEVSQDEVLRRIEEGLRVGRETNGIF